VDRELDERIAVFFSSQVLEHDTGRGFFEARPSEFLSVAEPHPENAARIENIKAVLERGPLASSLDWHDGRPALREELLRFHEESYLDRLARLDRDERHWVTETTTFGPASYRAMLAAAGTTIAAVDHVWSGAARLAYALVRPPGHHAQPGCADGYCFLNNIGVAIQSARSNGLQRVAVIDWDVHHGNGTQEGFYTDPDVLTISLHMDHGAWGASHRQTGAPEEMGQGEGSGANLNVALPMGCGDHTYLHAFDRLVEPSVRAFEPELLIVAAGQDANQFDPNGRQCVTMVGFCGLGRRARDLAEALCGGRLALVQEGGYALSYAPYCLHATLEGVLRRDSSLADPIAYLPDDTRQSESIVTEIERRWRKARGEGAS
jgi:acetoin utilization deacetylase AcuC-like enzyme